MKNWKSQFKEWLKEICPWGKVYDYVDFHTEALIKKYCSDIKEKESSLGVRIYTKQYCYRIKASERHFGCVMSVRKPRAGEDWTRYLDLLDGKFDRRTWDAIKNAIIASELVKIVNFKA